MMSTSMGPNAMTARHRAMELANKARGNGDERMAGVALGVLLVSQHQDLASLAEVHESLACSVADNDELLGAAPVWQRSAMLFVRHALRSCRP